ncbi:hypothetical protein DFA_10162 [Cavenderia fasciculata]|uniref:THH1/TOM1/TOM3 domain-containing protein n=1 Tax=Cavenderia fasciculata TaxID=261658 RepID=F4Q9F9_CACFS|nr:uncharacterized protein DFA_10162 [Cavenderia fasciculata]EGG15328.1 hypothetical protein DFA_10162 [Cavenderia fasciculata]|eukprot:XP_004352048.1 hypothetical protein DFA_10162 [Cavenderia fasciculata]
MYYGPNITAESLGGGPIYNDLAITYMIIRIIVCTYIIIICFTQVVLEYKYQISLKSFINPRIYTYFGVIMYLFFRILYTITFFVTGSETVGTVPDLLSFWSLFFQFYSWTWVGAYWGRLVLALFSVNILKYDKLVWISSWIMIGTSLMYVVIYHILAFKYPSQASNFFVGGFLAIAALYGGLCILTGTVLYRQIKKKEELFTDRINSIIGRIRILAIILTASIAIILVRDLIFYVILGIPIYSVLKHISNVITMIIEFAVAFCIMVSIAEKPYNYLTFKCVNPSMNKPLHEKESSASGRRMTISSRCSNDALSSTSSSSSNTTNVLPPKSKSKSQIQMNRLSIVDVQSILSTHQPNVDANNNSIPITQEPNNNNNEKVNSNSGDGNNKEIFCSGLERESKEELDRSLING